jgi:hypothetical protein
LLGGTPPHNLILSNRSSNLSSYWQYHGFFDGV